MNHNTKGPRSQEALFNTSTTQDQAFSVFMHGLTGLVPPAKPARMARNLASGSVRPPALPHGWEDLQDDFLRLHQAHTQFLFKHGVRLPRPGSQQLLSLIYLHRHMGTLVSLESLRDFVCRYIPGGSKDKQPRHLKYKGWHIVLSGKSQDLLPESAVYQDGRGACQTRNAGSKVPKGHLMLASDTTPSPDFIVDKRSGGIDRSTWSALCVSFGHCCAVCGKAGPLEKGHRDPAKGMEPDNLLPMCGECNNHASSDLVFDARGRIAAVASERFVATASLRTRMRIFDALRKDKAVNINRI